MGHRRDGEDHLVELRADLLVERAGRRYVVEVARTRRMSLRFEGKAAVLGAESAREQERGQVSSRIGKLGHAQQLLRVQALGPRRGPLAGPAARHDQGADGVL